MPDKWLKGNGKPCPECRGQRFVPSGRPSLAPVWEGDDIYPTRAYFAPGRKPCPTCKADGRVALTPEEIVAR